MTAAQKAAKKLRQEMKQRGHVGVLKKGEDPASDAHEKALYKIATRFLTPICYDIDNKKSGLAQSIITAGLPLSSTVHVHVKGMRLGNDMQGSSAAIQCRKQSSTVSEGSFSKWGQREGEPL